MRKIRRHCLGKIVEEESADGRVQSGERGMYPRTQGGGGGGFFWEAVSIGSPPRQKAGVQLWILLFILNKVRIKEQKIQMLHVKKKNCCFEKCSLESLSACSFVECYMVHALHAGSRGILCFSSRVSAWSRDPEKTPQRTQEDCGQWYICTIQSNGIKVM